MDMKYLKQFEKKSRKNREKIERESERERDFSCDPSNLIHLRNTDLKKPGFNSARLIHNAQNSTGAKDQTSKNSISITLINFENTPNSNPKNRIDRLEQEKEKANERFSGIIYHLLIEYFFSFLFILTLFLFIPGAGEFVELSPGREDNERDLGIAENGELERLLQQTVPPLRERHLPARGVLYPLHLRFPSHHLPSFSPPPHLKQGKK